MPSRPRSPDGIDPTSFYKVMIDLGGSATAHIVAGQHLEKLLQASHELYVDPGINPQTGAPGCKASKIAYARLLSVNDVRSLQLQAPAWWSTPGLGTDIETGAPTFVWKPDKDREAEESARWDEEVTYYDRKAALAA